MTTPITLTTADLDRLAQDYYTNLTHGGTGPEHRLTVDGDVEMMIDAEMGAGFRRIVSSRDLSEEGMGLAQFMAMTSTSDASLGRRVHMLAAAGEFEQKLNQYQREHQVSGLVEDLFEFSPLGFSTTQLRVGLWLELITGDAEQQQQAALRLGQEFLALAEKAGSSWLRYRYMLFNLEDGTEAHRYVRDEWPAFGVALETAGSATLDTGIFEVKDSSSKAMELRFSRSAWGHARDDSSYLLVHPSLAEQLDGPGQWWV